MCCMKLIVHELFTKQIVIVDDIIVNITSDVLDNRRINSHLVCLSKQSMTGELRQRFVGSNTLIDEHVRILKCECKVGSVDHDHMRRNIDHIKEITICTCVID